MTDDLSSVADDFFVNLNLQTAMALPNSRETVLHFCEAVQKQFGPMRSFFQREQERLREMAESLGGELLDNIETVIKEYGRENGFTLIIKKEEGPVQGRDWDELRSYVSRKSVMYYSANIDLTNKVVEILNKRYK